MKARLFCKWSFSILITDSVAFSPVHVPSLPLCFTKPVQRSKVSGVLAAVDKYGLMLLLAFFSPSAIANETCPSHVDTVKALLTSRQAPATLILSSMWNVPLPSCMFPLTLLACCCHLFSLCDGTADAGFLLKRLYSTSTLDFLLLRLLIIKCLGRQCEGTFVIYSWNRSFIQVRPWWK